MHGLQQLLDDGFFGGVRFRVNPLTFTRFELKALVNQQGYIAAVIDNELRT